MVDPLTSNPCSLPSASDTRESAIEFILGVARDRRFSNEYLGNVVRSWLNPLSSRLADETNEPSMGLLVSMAIRMDHGLGVPGYYDQPMFGNSGPTHQQRLDAAITTARQMWEEATGHGFYQPEKEAEYAARASLKANVRCIDANCSRPPVEGQLACERHLERVSVNGPAPLKCPCGRDLVPYAGCPVCDVPTSSELA